MPKPRSRRTAAEREARRVRIVAAIQNGASFDRIARNEGICRERVRQIVAETVGREGERERSHRLVEAARLAPALSRALDEVVAGKLEAVDRVLKILDRLDKYVAAAPSRVKKTPLTAPSAEIPGDSGGAPPGGPVATA